MLNIDELLYKIPFLGKNIRYLYAYFKRNIAFTDFIHVSIGLGLGLIIARGNWFKVGIIFLLIALVGHVYAFIKGKNES